MVNIGDLVPVCVSHCAHGVGLTFCDDPRLRAVDHGVVVCWWPDLVSGEIEKPFTKRLPECFLLVFHMICLFLQLFLETIHGEEMNRAH